VAYHLRPGRPADAPICGRICYDAFHAISTRHGFRPDFDNPEAATGLISMLLGQPEFYSVVAESGGRIVGSNFLDERSSVVGVGPVTVAPDPQDSGLGRALMRDVMERAGHLGAPGIRLVQATYHTRSLSLYAKLGLGGSPGTPRPSACLATPSARPSRTSRRCCCPPSGSTGREFCYPPATPSSSPGA
jgi:predicted N-acetyltransferase YhbS